MKRVIGLDISSTCIGIAVIDFEETEKLETKLIVSTYHNPIENDNIILRLDDTKKEILKIFEKYKPDFIAIEDIIQFMAGKTSANSIITLATFNRCLGLAAYEFLGKAPEYFNIMSIRHLIKRNSLLKSLPAKEDLPPLLEKLMSFDFKYDISKKGKIISTNYDRSDAIAVAYAFINKHNEVKVPKKIKKKK